MRGLAYVYFLLQQLLPTLECVRQSRHRYTDTPFDNPAIDLGWRPEREGTYLAHAKSTTDSLNRACSVVGVVALVGGSGGKIEKIVELLSRSIRVQERDNTS